MSEAVNMSKYSFLTFNYADWIYNEEDLQPEYTHTTSVQQIFRSKWEMWKFLSGDGEVYLPPYCNSTCKLNNADHFLEYFLSDVF